MVTPRKGRSAPQWLAAYLTRWWPNATATTIGYRGVDIKGTTGVAWEVKTANEFKPTGFVAQARRQAGGQLPVVVYVPNGVGEKNIEFALAIIPLHHMMDLLEDAEIAPPRHYPNAKAATP